MVENLNELGLDPLIPGYPLGSDITILNTIYKYPEKQENGKYDDGSITIFFIDNKTGETKHYILENPPYVFWYADDMTPIKHPMLFIEKEKVTRMVVPYKDLDKEIAKLTGQEEEYKNNIRSGNRYGNKMLHEDKRIFNSDMDINNHIRYLFDLMYTNSPITTLKKSYFDIEADTRYMAGDFPEMGECPVNALTFINDSDDSVHTFLLRDEKNPLIKEFESQCGPGMMQELSDFVIKSVGGFKKAHKYGVDKLHYNMYFFDEEIDLLRSFYRLVHKLKPHFMIAWNNAFDTPYITERIRNLGYDPKDIMCDHEFPKNIRVSKYWIDERHLDEFAERGDYYNISMDTVVLDQMIQFASRRKSKAAINSYRLDDIGEMIAGVNKLDYSHITDSISMLPYLDYKTFVFYNVMDVIVQKCIECRTNDLEYIFNKCLINNTMYQKGHRQTVYLIDRFTKEFYNDGYIIGNNHNLGKTKEKIRGASVGDPKHLNDYAKVIINGRPSMIARNLVDFDYKSMHPNMILQNNMAPNTQIGRIEIPEQIYEYENRFGVDVWHRQEDFAEAITTQNIINLCERWFGMASYLELVKDVREYFLMCCGYDPTGWNIHAQPCMRSMVNRNAVEFNNNIINRCVVFHNEMPDTTNLIRDLRKVSVVYAG